MAVISAENHIEIDLAGGHSVRLIPPVYVKPFVKRQKNDAADAEAIVEAALRPTMRFVAVKTEDQQARAMLFRTRQMFVGHPYMHKSREGFILDPAWQLGCMHFGVARDQILEPGASRPELLLSQRITSRRRSRGAAPCPRSRAAVADQSGQRPSVIRRCRPAWR